MDHAADAGDTDSRASASSRRRIGELSPVVPTASSSLHRDASHECRRILFRREIRSMRGGHLKVWHYFRHAMATPGWSASIHVVPGSCDDESNPWISLPDRCTPCWDPSRADVLFLAGHDWAAVPADTQVPAINLIQGFGHVTPGDPRMGYLRRSAVRICVSPELEDAVRQTGLANGPVLTIRNGLDSSDFPAVPASRDIDVLVLGVKEPALAAEVSAQLSFRGVHARPCTEFMRREDLLRLLGRSHCVVALPHLREGFFLPALEAMAMGALVVCPDCIGNRSFCREGVSCFVPERTAAGIAAAAVDALMLDGRKRSALLEGARASVTELGLVREAEQFREVLAGFVSGRFR
ncbi:MAG: glycosyltransferase family 4 protein [Phycisphaerales bacterium]|nr:glycosyltransferase family 4 protein [Phycisphaerales bacterium]